MGLLVFNGIKGRPGHMTCCQDNAVNTVGQLSNRRRKATSKVNMLDGAAKGSPKAALKPSMNDGRCQAQDTCFAIIAAHQLSVGLPS